LGKGLDFIMLKRSLDDQIVDTTGPDTGEIMAGAEVPINMALIPPILVGKKNHRLTRDSKQRQYGISGGGHHIPAAMSRVRLGVRLPSEPSDLRMKSAD
jgi:hypothetical protein